MLGINKRVRVDLATLAVLDLHAGAHDDHGGRNDLGREHVGAFELELQGLELLAQARLRLDDGVHQEAQALMVFAGYAEAGQG